MANGNVGSYGRYGNTKAEVIVKKEEKPRKDYLKSINWEIRKLNENFEKFIKYWEAAHKIPVDILGNSDKTKDDTK